jgi:pimeloyl-ACP methyl ester carboxylesterase
LLTPIFLGASLYATAGTMLYVNQRDIIFQPADNSVAPPPQGSIYTLLPVTTESGGRLTVWASPAANTELPTIVFFHGNASDVRDFAQFGTRLHALGYGVVLASYRGYSGNDRAPSEDGLFEDGRAILDAVSVSGPIILWGHSLGSGVATRLASEMRADALILESPFTSLTELGSMLYPLFPVDWLLTDRFDSASLAPNIEMPVLILHSRDDTVVPFALGAKLAAAFGANARLVALDHLGHYPHQADLSGALAGWLHETGIVR